MKFKQSYYISIEEYTASRKSVNFDKKLFQTHFTKASGFTKCILNDKSNLMAIAKGALKKHTKHKLPHECMMNLKK